jgi:hypothetical protein
MRRNALRAGPVIKESREENDRLLAPPPIREGMNPLKLPPYGMIGPEPLVPAVDIDEYPP